MKTVFQVLLLFVGAFKIASLGVAGPAASDFGAKLGGPETPDHRPIQVPLPESLHLQNTGGSDGAGLCVFTSIEHASRWQNIEVLQGFQAWCKKRPGGGYPQKVDKFIDDICREKHAAKPAYIQIESADIDILKKACKTHRCPGVTYGYSPSGRYAGQKISHMVSLLHADDQWFCVLDNNFPKTYEWMTPDEFFKTYTSGGKTGWCVIFLAPSPPPPIAERKRPHAD